MSISCHSQIFSRPKVLEEIRLDVSSFCVMINRCHRPYSSYFGETEKERNNSLRFYKIPNFYLVSIKFQKNTYFVKC